MVKRNNRKIVSLWLPISLVENIDAEAKVQDRSRSYILKKILEQCVSHIKRLPDKKDLLET